MLYSVDCCVEKYGFQDILLCPLRLQGCFTVKVNIMKNLRLVDFLKQCVYIKKFNAKIFHFKTFISQGIKQIRYLWRAPEKDFSPCLENIQWRTLQARDLSLRIPPSKFYVTFMIDINMVGMFFRKNVINCSNGCFQAGAECFANCEFLPALSR